MTPALPSGLSLLLDRLRGVVGPDHVSPAAPPFIRVRPGSAAEVTGVLQAAAIGGVRASLQGAPEALVHLDLGRLDQLLSVSATSLLCEAQAGLRLCDLEHRLRERQLTLGPLPAPTLLRTLGAVLAAPRPPEASPALGRLCDRAARLVAVVPFRGPAREMAVPAQVAPRRASGPDLRHLLIGSRGRTGIIAAATLVLSRAAAETRCAGWMLPSAGAAVGRLCEGFFALGGTGPADLQVASPELLRQAAPQAALPPGAAALLVRAEGPAAAEQVRRFAPEAPPLPDELCRLWLGDPPPQPEPLRERAAWWPATARALPLLPAALTAAFAGAPGPRLICGVHLHGAALCTNVPCPPERGETDLLERIRAEIDPQGLLC
jgi:FAD/FMN-containing dehydrogenase